MFSKLKQFKELRDKAKQMQAALSEESVTIEEDGVKLVMNGNLEVVLLTIEDGINKSKLEQSLRTAFNDGVKKVQKLMAKKMQEMGGLPGLS
ncbi:YbaB/EbfC family nucleoid-associated protein [Patescibacteria group bacterium]|nr:YbaB/EbfC family nucleoid-associated protein [Patescibacteria group bacterium]